MPSKREYNHPLTLDSVLQYLESHLDVMLSQQISDVHHTDYGGLVSPQYGIADARYSGQFIAACAYVAISTGEAGHLSHATLAADFILRAQRPSGCIDLLSANYDSSPDTGFAVQELCTVLELARSRGVSGLEWEALLEKLELFIRRAVPGLSTGGFHTPNHRWVITSALVQAEALFPDLDVQATVDAYLAEGFDIDAEGMFIERSVGVYDAVNTRSLLFIAQHRDRPDALEAVARCLDLDLHLLHADGTAETGLSRRQDYGTRTVPLRLAPCYLMYHAVRPNATFVQAAQMLWEQAGDGERHTLWLAYALLRYGNPEYTSASLPNDFVLHLPLNGIWRVRRERLSASAFRDSTRLFSLAYGRATLSSVKISQTYFGRQSGRFIGDEMTACEGGVLLHSEGLGQPRRPGYEQPLGRPVPPEQWHAMLTERELRHVPPARSTLMIQETDQGFDLHYQTVEGLAGVAAQIALDFAPGGIWETADTCLRPQAGQVLFLKGGYGIMRYGNDAIRIEPGADAHRMWQMREAEIAPDHVRVLLTFLTPVDHTLHLRVYRGLINKD